MNVKPNFLKIMKQKIFTLIMMLALVIVAGRAFSQTNMNPYPGGSYTYTLPYTLNHAGEVTLTLTGVGTLNGTTTPSGLTSGGGAVALSSGSGSIIIPISYGTSASGDETIAIAIKDNTSGCSNNIQLTVTIESAPSMTLDIANSLSGHDYGCQNLNLSPASNVDASVGAPTNTITYTVTPGSSPTGLASYTYTFGVSGMGATSLASGSHSLGGSFNTTFTTAEGAGGTVTGTISSASFTMDADHGGQTYDMTLTHDHIDVTVGALPTIGTFN